jgi:hypothetical protein
MTAVARDLPSPPPFHPRAEALARLVEMSCHRAVDRVELIGTEGKNALTCQPLTRWRCSVWIDGILHSALHNSPELAIGVVFERFMRRIGAAA